MPRQQPNLGWRLLDGLRVGEKCRWLRFVNTYRTMCIAPEPEFRRVLEEIQEMRLAA